MRSLLATAVSIAALSSLAAVILLSALVWLFAPALLNSDGLLWRSLLTALPVLAWLVVIPLLAWRRSRRDAALVAGATEPQPQAPEAKVSEAYLEDEAEMSRQLSDALGALRKAANGKGGYLYDRPWYVIIGPPGSGKTTAIRSCGLDFPLNVGRIKGVGGTRNCEWWVSEQAVLIDTAGRYTTQDSDRAADKEGWERFLGLLRRERPRQPINGVIVAFAVDLLSNLDQKAREANARAVRLRIAELEEKLGQRLPVYFLVSKADLIVGFTEFFDDLDREARAQVWGMTFPAGSGPSGQAGRFAQEFGALVTRLQDRSLERLQAERGPEQRARIAGFIAQFASLEQVLASFIESAFGGSRLDPAPFLRGVYFTSGTQEGSPIDRLTGVLSRTFGLAPRRPGAVTTQTGKSYFLGRLLRNVVFNESSIAARDGNRDRRRLAIRIGVWSLALLTIIGGGLWGYSQMRAEEARAAKVNSAMAAIQAASKGLAFDPVANADDLPQVLSYLDSVQGLSTAATEAGFGFGVGQQDKLLSAAQTAYHHALERVFLPRLLDRLENQMRAGLQKSDFLYEATRVYLMLGRQGILDKGLVTEWMRLDWDQLFPGAVGAATRDGLMGHLQALLDEDFHQYPIDDAVVAQARVILSKQTMAQRVYERLLVGAAPPPWRVAEMLGPAGQPLFRSVSGRPLADVSVRGLYTTDGLRKSFLPRLPAAITEAASESWVLGEQASAALATDPRQLEEEVLALYADDYASAWQALLADLTIVPFNNLKQASDGLNVLGAPTSPIRDVLQRVTRQLAPGTKAESTAIDPKDAGKALQATAQAVGGAAAAGIQAAQSAAESGSAGRLSSLIGTAPGADPGAVVNDNLAKRFAPLFEAAGPQLDSDLSLLADLYKQVSQAASTAPGSPPLAELGDNPAQRLAADAKLRPEPLSRWLAVIAKSTASLTSSGVKATIAAAANQLLTPFCSKPEARFPFNRGSTAEMPIDDFNRLFGRGVGFDQFLSQYLRPYVDTTQNPWRPAAPDGMTPPVTQEAVAQLQRAAAIRDAFFPSTSAGGSQGLRFDLTPLGIDAGATNAILEVEGALTPIQPGQAVTGAAQLQWPARSPVTLTFEPAGSATPLSADGPWAALKFVAKGRLARGKSPDRMRLSFQQGERSAEFELRTGSIVNPFALRALSEFRCPQFLP